MRPNTSGGSSADGPKRFDPNCPRGKSYTRRQFVVAYGGTAEWDAAKGRGDGPRKAKLPRPSPTPATRPAPSPEAAAAPSPRPAFDDLADVDISTLSARLKQFRTMRRFLTQACVTTALYEMVLDQMVRTYSNMSLPYHAAS